MRQAHGAITKKIQLPLKIKQPVLAVGSQAKNTVCFAQGNFAYMSRVHADLDNPQDYLSFLKDAKYFLKRRPKVIAHDLHPEYQSTKYALSLQTPNSKLPTQHHHAHIASCMAENSLKNQKVIGVAFDGTGLGSDSAIWGAEFLICDYKNFKRAAHLKEIPLLGGERAILEPWRLVSAWLGRAKDKKKWRVLKKMQESGFNSPLASSMGRLFDAVGSLILAKDKANFEAELAMELEKLASTFASSVVRRPYSVNAYKFKVAKKENTYILDPLPMIRQIEADLQKREPKERIAYRFHLTVAEMVKKICLALRKEAKINKVVLSGGVFQNKLLLCLARELLYKEGFAVFTHQELSCNDSGISLGQAIIASRS